ncbi:ATP-binding protein [Allocoprobacillus halotolerans]|uniref:ATP-binding protein n=1 Tax=Allocoprobacillus halotolerans TaxID=2944914 RepID=A0ABY5I040_9FIRM|nr:ATP-binding protein [Allocoprobacillus halotolerans]UTY38167.1 ATP-binding protein [Allocoprobacillus halotolerans]
MEETNVANGIVKGLVFVGPNSSGKSNAIHAISVLLDLLFIESEISIPLQMCFYTGDNLELSYLFEIDQHDILYEFSFNRSGNVVDEKLYLDNKKLLTRLGQEAETELSETTHYHSDSIAKNVLFLRTIYFNTHFAKFPILKKWFTFLQNSVYCDFSNNLNIAFSPKTLNKLQEHITEETVDKMNQFLKESKIGYSVKYTNESKISEFSNINLGDKKEFFVKKEDCDYWMPLHLESQGNKEFIPLIPAILHIINNDGMFIIDEFNAASFHNELEELIIKYILKNSKQSQLIIATHSTNVLKTSLFRPDQIYSVDFIGNEGSVIKRISSESPRQSQNLEKMYLSGIFDGIPNYRNK